MSESHSDERPRPPIAPAPAAEPIPAAEPESPVEGRWPWLPYVAPMATFLLLTWLEDFLPANTPGASTVAYYPAAYTIKLAVMVFVLWLCRSTWRDLRPWPGVGALAAGVALGLAVAAAWVGLDGYYPVPGQVGARAAYDPMVLTPASRVAFLAVRFSGLVLVVPLFEELFWRSFVVRWLHDPDDFRRVPIGFVNLGAAATTAGLFALEHPAEWLPALATGFAWAGLLRQTRSVAACFVSHAVANLGLGLYVMATHQWKFW